MPNPQAVGHNQVTVTTSATQIAPARPDRRSVTIILTGDTPQQTFIGGPNVSASNGFPLPAVEGASITIRGGAAIYGIVAATTQGVGYIEVFG